MLPRRKPETAAVAFKSQQDGLRADHQTTVTAIRGTASAIRDNTVELRNIQAQLQAALREQAEREQERKAREEAENAAAQLCAPAAARVRAVLQSTDAAVEAAGLCGPAAYQLRQAIRARAGLEREPPVPTDFCAPDEVG